MENAKRKRVRPINIRFTESEMQDIKSKCEQFSYKSKSTYVRDCVKARVDLSVDRAIPHKAIAICKIVSKG